MKKLLFMGFLLLFLTGITNAQSNTAKVKSEKPDRPSIHENKEIFGIASYYADKFQGRQTANGDIYLKSEMTAACNLLPLNRWIRVTNLKNKKSVIVKITDRMNPKNTRLVDLSRAAARNLNFIADGLTRVKVEVLKNYKGPGVFKAK